MEYVFSKKDVDSETLYKGLAAGGLELKAVHKYKDKTIVVIKDDPSEDAVFIASEFDKSEEFKTSKDSYSKLTSDSDRIDFIAVKLGLK